VIRSIGKFRGEAPLGIWMRQVACSKALMFLRSAWHKRGQSLDDDWEEMMTGTHVSHDNAARPEQAIDLDAALGTLPAVSRTVVWLHDVEGYTHKEIAVLLGKSESFSKSQLSRAYQKLRPMLDAERGRNDAVTSIQGSALEIC